MTATYWQFFAMALFIVFAALRDVKPRAILWRIALSSFIILLIFDVVFSLYWNNFTIRSFSENVVGNFIGSLIISNLIVVVIYLADFLFMHVPANAIARGFVAGSSVIISGFVFLVFMYYLADLFYNPLSVRLEAHLASPLSGGLVFKEKDSPRVNNNDIRVNNSSQSLVPEKAIRSHASWQSAEGQQEIAFSGLSPNTRYNVELTFLSGLCTSEKIKKLHPVEPSMKFSDINKGNIFFDEGVSFLDILTLEFAAAKYSISIKDSTGFWFGQDSSSKETHLTHFLSKGDSVKIVTSHRVNSFILSAPTLEEKAGKMKLTARTLTAKLGASAYAVRFIPSKTVRSDNINDCKIVSAADMGKSDNAASLSANGISAVSNVLVMITQDEDPQTLSSEETEFLVSGGGGWFKLDPMKADEFDGHHVGTLKVVQAKGNISELALDGQAMPVRPLSTYTAIGEFTAGYGAGGALMVSGLAKMLWKDNGRLNMTKWEKLAWEPMLLILGLLGSAIVWVSARLTKCLRANSPFNWLS